MFYLLFRFSDLPWACLRHALQEKRALFSQDCNTTRGNFAFHLLLCEPKQSLDCEQFLSQHSFFFLAHCKFAHTWPVEMEWITRLNEQKQPGSYNYCECDTQINEPILKAKRMGQVNDATIEKRLALGLRKSFRWQQNYKQRGATFATLEK